MLSDSKVRCPYCKQIAYFYVFTWKKDDAAAIYTQCPNPKCSKYIDVWYFPLVKYEKYLASVLKGLDPSEDIPL